MQFSYLPEQHDDPGRPILSILDATAIKGDHSRHAVSANDCGHLRGDSSILEIAKGRVQVRIHRVLGVALHLNSEVLNSAREFLPFVAMLHRCRCIGFMNLAVGIAAQDSDTDVIGNLADTTSKLPARHQQKVRAVWAVQPSTNHFDDHGVAV